MKYEIILKDVENDTDKMQVEFTSKVQEYKQWYTTLADLSECALNMLARKT